MYIDVNGTRLWFDVDGLGLVPDGSQMRHRSTVVLVHGGPGVYDHSYFKPDFDRTGASPGHAAGLIIQSGFARWDMARMVEGFRQVAGDEVAHIAERSYSGEEVTDEQGARVSAAFGMNLPDDEREAHTPKNLPLN